MIQRLGNIVSKSHSVPSVIQYTKVSEVRRKSDNSLLSTFGAVLPVTVSSGSDTITYTLGNKANKAKSNFCRHLITRTKYSGDPQSYLRTDEVSGSNYYNLGFLHSDSEATHATAITTAKAAFGVPLQAALLGSQGQTMIDDASIDLKPDLTSVSVPNFLLDIEDLTSLFKLWKKDLGIAKNLAGAHLNYKFGWKPVMGDLSAMVEVLSSMNKKLADWEKSLNTLFHKSKVVLSDTITKSGSFNQGGSSSRPVRWSASVSRKVTAHLVWKPQPLQVLGTLDRVTRGLLDSLGFELNPQIVWDALPFTFVLDWFFDVGSFLGQFKLDTLELPIMYVDGYLQYKEEAKYDSFLTDSYNDTTKSPWCRSGGWVTEEKFFHRLPIMPSREAFKSLGCHFPSLNQAALLVSLATVLSD